VPSASYLLHLLSQDAPQRERLRVVRAGDHGASPGDGAAATFTNIEVFEGGDATEDKITGEGPYDVFQVSCNGVFDSVDPTLSYLDLETGDASEGWVHAAEFLATALPASLAVFDLDIAPPAALFHDRELAAFSESLLFGGVPAFLANLWTVPDAQAAALLDAFYGNLETMSAAEALRQAKRSLREQFPDAYHWAAFVLHGDGR